MVIIVGVSFVVLIRVFSVIVLIVFILKVSLMVKLDIVLIFSGISFCVQIIVMEKFDIRIKLINVSMLQVSIGLVNGSKIVSGVEQSSELRIMKCFLKWFVSGLLRNVLIVLNSKKIKIQFCVC